MGVKTLSTIVSEGMALGGRTDTALATPVAAWVNNWLEQTYLQWPWPFLYKSRAQLTLAAAAQSQDVGAGNGGITNRVQRIIDPIWVYESTGNGSIARVRKLTGGVDPQNEERVQVAANYTGKPTTFRIRPGSTGGIWTLVPQPFPDKAYLLAFDYIELPASLATSDTPIYPNDLTLVQAALVATLLYVNGHDDPAYQDAIQVLAKRVSQDRTGFGNALGINDTVDLDEGVYS
jgi:hypothetical protein